MKKKLLNAAGLVAALILVSASASAQTWDLTGNAGTVSGTDFLGTTDNVALRLRTNNTDRLYIASGGFVGIGTTTQIGSANFVISSAINNWGGMYTNAASSTARPFYGYSVQGTAVAWHYYDPSTSTWILHVGYDRLFVTNNGNVGIGTSTPSSMLDVAGNGNFNSITTSGSISSGSISCSSLSSSSAVSGSSFSTGNFTMNNSGLSMSGTHTFTITPEVVFNGDATFNSTWFHAKQIEGRTTSSAAGVTGFAIANNPSLVSYGVFGTSNGSPFAYGLACSGNGYYTGDWYDISDAKFKTNLHGLNNALSIVMQLQPRTYEFKQSEYPQMNFPAGMHYGFIAQEMEKVTPNLVASTSQPVDMNNPDGEQNNFKMVNYIGLIPVLTEAIKEQQAIIQRQDSIINAQNERLDRLESKVNGSSSVENKDQLNRLYQNQPNPAGQETVIRYAVDPNAASAYVVVRDMQGNVVKTIPVSQKGEGALTIQSQELGSGVYTYELVVDGKLCDSRKMVIAK